MGDEGELDEPLSEREVVDLVRRILKEGGRVRFTTHSQDEMEADGLQEPDIVNVLRGGWVYQPGEFENGSWRYRVETDRIAVVVAFRAADVLVVVTVWRKKRSGKR